MKRFSVSCLNTYETCSYKCKLQYNVLGEDKLEDDLNFYGEFGSLLHDLFDRYYKNVEHLDKTNMIELFHNGVSNLSCEFPDGKKQQYLDSAIEQIDWFYERYADMKPIATEEEFDEFIIDGVPLHFKGFIDRIDGTDEEIVISDYKTGRSSKFTKRELSDNIQATVYALYIKHKYGFYPKRFVFIFTKERKTKEIEINEAFIERGLARIKRITKNIEDGIFVPDSSGGKFFCKNFCKFYSDGCPKFEKREELGGWNL